MGALKPRGREHSQPVSLPVYAFGAVVNQTLSDRHSIDTLTSDPGLHLLYFVVLTPEMLISI